MNKSIKKLNEKRVKELAMWTKVNPGFAEWVINTLKNIDDKEKKDDKA